LADIRAAFMIRCMDDTTTTTVASLIGLPCWGVEHVHGSILSFEFGSPRLFVREPYVSTSSSPGLRASAARRVVKPVGEWNHFVFCCHWRVVTAGEVLADDDSLPAQIEAAAQAMDGQRLTAFELDAASHQAVLSSTSARGSRHGRTRRTTRSSRRFICRTNAS
jgi:hypothetical protein